jgi:hypothetical protein
MHPCATPRHHDALYYVLCSTALHTALHHWSTPLPHSTAPLRVHCSVHCIMAPLHHWCTPLHVLLRCDALHHCTTATSSLHYTATPLPHATAPLHALLLLHCITSLRHPTMPRPHATHHCSTTSLPCCTPCNTPFHCLTNSSTPFHSITAPPHHGTMTSLHALLPLHHFAALLHYITVALHDVLCGCGGSCSPSLRWRPCKPQSRRRAQVPRPQFGTVDRSVVFNVCAPTQFAFHSAPLHHGTPTPRRHYITACTTATASLHCITPLRHHSTPRRALRHCATPL